MLGSEAKVNLGEITPGLNFPDLAEFKADFGDFI
jgi:hypothetical protein